MLYFIIFYITRNLLFSKLFFFHFHGYFNIISLFSIFPCDHLGSYYHALKSPWERGLLRLLLSVWMLIDEENTKPTTLERNGRKIKIFWECWSFHVVPNKDKTYIKWKKKKKKVLQYCKMLILKCKKKHLTNISAEPIYRSMLIKSQMTNTVRVLYNK